MNLGTGWTELSSSLKNMRLLWDEGKADWNDVVRQDFDENHWTPLEINMAQDVHDYHHKLTPSERHLFENVLAYLTTSDILAMRNIGLAVMEKMSAPELQIYQARQVYEEALHTWTYQHCIESLGRLMGAVLLQPVRRVRQLVFRLAVVWL